MTLLPPLEEGVVPAVRSVVREQSEVAQPVVSRVLVDVVHDLLSMEEAAEVALHDQPMLKHVSDAVLSDATGPRVIIGGTRQHISLRVRPAVSLEVMRALLWPHSLLAPTPILGGTGKRAVDAKAVLHIGRTNVELHAALPAWARLTLAVSDVPAFRRAEASRRGWRGMERHTANTTGPVRRLHLRRQLAGNRAKPLTRAAREVRATLCTKHKQTVCRGVA